MTAGRAALLRRYAPRSGRQPPPRQRHDRIRCRRPAQRWRVARTLPRRVTAGRGAHCCAGTPRVQAVSRRRASVMIASVAPPGAALARCPDVAPARDRRQGGALLRRYAPRSGRQPPPRQRHDRIRCAARRSAGALPGRCPGA
ncbi:hypothetical protein JYY74_004227 [Salmonella enterica subsp. enterica serovar Enteritidis]|nr:hypothetical protein [Salmonella enterica subsp. enterica serovar Enteritidis]